MRGAAQPVAAPAEPVVELGVSGPRGRAGFLLRAPWSEALVWDLESEVPSARRCWVAERGGVWIAASYLEAVLEIALRSFPAVSVLCCGEAVGAKVARSVGIASLSRGEVPDLPQPSRP